MNNLHQTSEGLQKAIAHIRSAITALPGGFPSIDQMLDLSLTLAELEDIQLSARISEFESRPAFDYADFDVRR